MADSNQINTSDATSTDVSVNETNPSVDTKETAAVTQPGTSNATVSSPEMKNVQDLTRYVELLLQQMQERFQGISDQVLARIDEMGNRIDDLERNIADLVTQSGLEGPPK